MNPLAILALLAGGSMVANAKAQDKVNDGRRKADELAKQVREKNYATAEAARQKALEGIKSTGDNQVAAAQERTAEYKAVQEPIATRADLVSPEDRGSSAVVAEEARQKDKARAFTNTLAEKRGQIDSLSDVFLDQNILQARTGRDISTAGQATNSWVQNVLPAQLERANRSGDTLRTIADLFQMGAQMYGMHAMNGASGLPGGVSPKTAIEKAQEAAYVNPLGGGIGGRIGLA